MATRHIVYMRLSDLTPAERNAKLHDLPSMVASLTRFGFTNPILIDERTARMVAGHGRREGTIALKQAGDPPPNGVLIDEDGEWMVPVLRGWESRDDVEALAYVIADNKLTEAGGWHMVSLATDLEDVITNDAGLMETIGMTAEDIDDLIRRVDPEKLNLDSDPWEDDEKPSKAAEPADPYAVDDQEAVPAEKPADADEGTQETGLEDEATGSQDVTCPSCSHTFEVA